uniref:Uncharacterized protein n=1 Tax=Ailuropoda melanoleuca TaxID=9646 RepID=A0A7N5JFL7_AILME
FQASQSRPGDLAQAKRPRIYSRQWNSLHRRPGAGHCSSSPSPVELTARMPGQRRG